MNAIDQKNAALWAALQELEEWEFLRMESESRDDAVDLAAPITTPTIELLRAALKANP